MKKLMITVSVLSFLVSCANTDDKTLEDFWREAISESQSVEDNSVGTKEEEILVKEVLLPEKQEGEIVVIETSDTYQLPSRNERFSSFAPLPEVYAIPAARATNKMLDETREFYEANDDVFLFITDLKKGNAKLPDGVYKAEQVTRKIIEGSKTFKVTNDKSEADYILETMITNSGSIEDPIFEYKMILIDTENNKINEWIERVRRVTNDDRSWW